LNINDFTWSDPNALPTPLENTPSLSLVRKHGFKEIGRREKIGKMTYGDLAGTWRDVILVERRSTVTGID
jgi:L-amino acid N-acyltransferase YncA